MQASAITVDWNVFHELLDVLGAPCSTTTATVGGDEDDEFVRVGLDWWRLHYVVNGLASKRAEKRCLNPRILAMTKKTSLQHLTDHSGAFVPVYNSPLRPSLHVMEVVQ